MWNPYLHADVDNEVAVRVEIEQIAGRRLVARARGNEVVIDDTIEAGGPGDGFRPTELLMAALGTCMAGTMISFARNQDIAVSGIVMTLEDEEHHHPERIGSVTVTLAFDTDAEDRRVRTLERIAKHCKIHATLRHGSHVDLELVTRR